MDGIRGSLSEIMRFLLHQRYTGAIVVHMRSGEPQIVEYGRPGRLEIVPGLPEAKIPLTPSKPSP